MKSNQARVELPLLLLFSTVTALLLCFLVLMFYSCPVSDDFIRAARDKSMSAFMASTYFNWSGRLASHALEGGILPGIDIVAHYPVLIVSLALLQILGIYAFWRLLLDQSGDRLLCLALACGTTTVLWSCLPSIAQSLYWFTGAIENQLPSAMIALLIWGILAVLKSRAKGVVRFCVLGALAVFCLLTAAMHELYAIVLCGVLAAAVFIARRLKTGTHGIWAAYLCVALLGTAIVVTAPGNSRRAEVTAARNDAWPTTLAERFEVVTYTALRQVKQTSLWVVDPKLLTLAVVFLLSPRIRRSNPGWYRRDPVLWKWIVPSTGLALLVPIVLGPCWSLCALPAPRTLGVAYTVFLLTACASAFILTRPTSDESVQVSCPLLQTIYHGALYVAIVALLATGNSRSAMRDLLQQKARRCRDAVVARDHAARAGRARGLQHMSFPPLPSSPECFWVWNDIISDESCPRNRAVAKYYGFASVALDQESSD